MSNKIIAHKSLHVKIAWYRPQFFKACAAQHNALYAHEKKYFSQKHGK